jgi:nicotinamide-nucleotide amidase
MVGTSLIMDIPPDSRPRSVHITVVARGSGQEHDQVNMISETRLRELSEHVGRVLLEARRRVATAESCTGGWLAKCLTDIAGSSQWFERGYITYSNASKEQALAVTPSTLNAHGAVSAQTAEAMAAGCLEASGADLAIAITGIAGPDGGTAAKPVGLVWFGLAERGHPARSQQRLFAGDRETVRRSAVALALELLGATAAPVLRQDSTGP